MAIAGVLLVAGQLVAPIAADDARRVPHLEAAIDAVVEGTSARDEDALAAMLLALERLDRESALERARSILALPAGPRLSLVAHGVAARAGDVAAVRSALARYHDDPASWREVLGDAAVANDDVRLRDFREFAARDRPEPTESSRRAVFRTTLLRFLGETASRVVPVRTGAAARPPRAESVDAKAADAFVELYRLDRLDPPSMLRWLGGADGELREKAELVMALSGDPSRLPLLIELAVGGSGAGREAAFRALAEMDLGDFDMRLHRLAGDPDGGVRFQTALALAPTGDEWALRLLFAELDEDDAVARQRSRRALERVSDSVLCRHVETMIVDGTATPFAIERYLARARDAEREIDGDALWELLERHVAAESPRALLAAARLDHPDARSAVQHFLERR